jgi:hypothetical protein
MMRFSKSFFVLLLFFCSFPVFPQRANPADKTPPAAALPDKERANRIKADILREIKALPNGDQAQFYASLGSAYWEKGDLKEGLLWLAKGVELGTSPAAEYADDGDKLTAYWNLLSEVLEKDAGLAAKLIVKIRKIKIDESNPEQLTSANKTYIVIAQQILTRKKDENLALEFALLSLRGPKPAVNWKASEFFRPFKATNENLAGIYFARLVEAVKNSENTDLNADLVSYFVIGGLSNYPTKDARFTISDAQKKDVLEILIPFIQKDSDDFISKKINQCGISAHWGSRFSEDYNRLLPEKAPLVRQALAVCATAEREPWEKTELYKKPRKTIEELVELAGQIPQKQARTNFLLSAASKARNENKWSLANQILNDIDKDFRQSFWISLKIETVAKLLGEHFRSRNYAEITRPLDDSPPELRPFIIVNCLSVLTPQPDQRDFVLNLLNFARAAFNKMDRYPADPWDSLLNPTKFAELAKLYVKFRYFDEAVAAHEEAIKSLNRLVGTLAPEFPKMNSTPFFSSFSTFSNQFPRNDSDFIDRYFDRIYGNIGQIEPARVRLWQRLYFLAGILEKSGQIPRIPFSDKSLK